VSGTTTARDLWPWLLLLALLLWPFDVGVRRMSVGRRDMTLARAWVSGWWTRWRSPSARTASVDAMLQARGRAGGAKTRGSLRGGAPGSGTAVTTDPSTAGEEAAAVSTASPAVRSATQARAMAAPPAGPTGTARTTTPAPPRPAAPPPAAPAPPAAAPAPPAEADGIARLRDAKRRARR
jgi:hypothetical protein